MFCLCYSPVIFRCRVQESRPSAALPTSAVLPVCQLGSYLLKLQPFSTLVRRMGESRVQGLQRCCGKISMSPQDKLKWPPWFNTPGEDGCNNVDLSHSWGSWKKWCVQAAEMRSPILHNLAVIGRIFKFERSALHNCIHSTGSAKFCLSIPEQTSAARV